MLYTITPCTGIGFITHEDRESFEIQGFGGDVWVTDESQAAHDWIVRNSATEITKEDAQAAVDAAFAIAYDAKEIPDIIPHPTEPPRLP